jgi:glyoxylase-like metal-dependent hydrolase (beta-lactamase superfamily II)
MFARFSTTSLLAAALTLGAAAPVLAADALRLDVYNPGTAALFPVSSVLVSGAHDAILIDAQFGKTQAAELVERIRASGKTLTTIYISHGDPDYYFGLETLRAAYPSARIVASAPTVAHIRQTMAAKLAFWGPKLGADAPASTIVPETLDGDTLKLEGHTLAIVGLHGRQPDRSFVWIPSIKAVVGGVVLFNNQHVWMADTQSAQSHADWLATLRTIARLHPRTVVPGHALPGPSSPRQSVAFTAGYIRAFDAAASRSHDAGTLIAAMKARYPQAGEEGALDISARVATGEMKW